MGSEHCAPGLIASFSSTSPLAVQYQFQCQKSSVGSNEEQPLERHIDDLTAAEHEIEELFDDCVPGAIPPVGECYGLDTVVDDSIEEQPEVYLEGGDHATLVHMTHAQFASLTATARHGSFSVHARK